MVLHDQPFLAGWSNRTTAAQRRVTGLGILRGSSYELASPVPRADDRGSEEILLALSSSDLTRQLICGPARGPS